ncbi:MAG: GerMN domain-containing protein, partial [Lachnospiraceae bacterium]|nr:GerMN domain-containing protein [Lachnospiraceae bacterium]
ERMVINEVLAGPKEEGHYATLPTSVKVNGVQVKNGICYVNLSGAFVNDALNISEYVAVYSLVNSLVELNTVNKVQIMIDGSSAITFRGSISFEKPLERKLDCVE